MSPSQLVSLAKGWQLVDAGDFVAARRSFQTLINDYGAREPASAYALLAIAEAFALEGGEGNLRQASAVFRDFGVFYPNHELTSQAHARLAEIQQALRVR